jgi:hypothetical protein
MAARTLQPETGHDLAHVLVDRDESDEAIAIFKDLVRLRPSELRHQVCLGGTMKDHGLNEEAKPVLERAVAALNSQLRLDTQDGAAHDPYGNTHTLFGHGSQ